MNIDEGIIAVAIVAYGRADEVTSCLAALARSTFRNFEVLVIENGGAACFDRLIAAVAKDWPVAESINAVADPARTGNHAWRQGRLPGGQPATLLQASENLGYAGAVNLAMQALGDGPRWRGVWVLNPDTEPDPAALEAVVERSKTGDYGLVGSRIILAGTGRVQLRGARWRWLLARGWSIGRDDPADLPVDEDAVERQLHWLPGTALYATRAFIEAVGPMNEKYFLYCEDTDWSLRHGRFRLGYAHRSIVHHHAGSTIGSASCMRARSDLSVYLGARNPLLMTRDLYPVLYPIVVATNLLLLPDYLVRGNYRVFAAACRGWWAGVRGEVGRPASFFPLGAEDSADR
jgi:N-acetylglucosaminyl-diphospho-decaprenol L-rhamnosyltransferase